MTTMIRSLPWIATTVSLCVAATAQNIESNEARPASVRATMPSSHSVFVRNKGQWDAAVEYRYQQGPMTLFLKDRGWVVDLRAKTRAVAVAMTFEGCAAARLVGERSQPGALSYFCGNGRERWQADVGRFGAVRYEGLYKGVDVRMRHAGGVPEYDVLLAPGADLAAVVVKVAGARGMKITADGSLRIETALGPIHQPAPKTWQTDSRGATVAVPCRFRILAGDRFGFAAPTWDRERSLTIDPGLVWSTLFGGTGHEYTEDVHVAADGTVVVAGWTYSTALPTTPGAYDVTFNGRLDSYVARFDPTRTGAAQLLSATYFGGNDVDQIYAVAVDRNGVITLAGRTSSTNFPTTTGAFDRTFGGAVDGFVARLDPRKSGAAQLVYSTFVGGGRHDVFTDVAVDAAGLVTVVGSTYSPDYPTTAGAYDRTHNTSNVYSDIVISRLDPTASGAAQLVYSTFVGGDANDNGTALHLASNGIVTVTGSTSSKAFPTTPNAFDRTLGVLDAFACRIDPTRTGAAQLVYSTLLGGNAPDQGWALAVESGGGIVVSGQAYGSFPVTANAFDQSYGAPNHPFLHGDVFVSRLDPTKAGAAQLTYSTYLGDKGIERPDTVTVDADGVFTVSGSTTSAGFPTSSNAFDRTYNLSDDVFVSRIDPRKKAAEQLVYSTFLGGSSVDQGRGHAVDGSGLVTVVGHTVSAPFPTTTGAYSRVGSRQETFVTRLQMGVRFYGDRHALSLRKAGAQNLTLDAGSGHGGRPYAIFGSLGTSPGITLDGVHIPLNPDAYTSITIGSAQPPVFVNFRGTLSPTGTASAALRVPSGLPSGQGLTVYHAYLVLGAGGRVLMASNPVPLALR